MSNPGLGFCLCKKEKTEGPCLQKCGARHPGFHGFQVSLLFSVHSLAGTQPRPCPEVLSPSPRSLPCPGCTLSAPPVLATPSSHPGRLPRFPVSPHAISSAVSPCYTSTHQTPNQPPTTQALKGERLTTPNAGHSVEPLERCTLQCAVGMATRRPVASQSWPCAYSVT